LALTATVLTMALSPLVSGAALPLGRAWRKWAGPEKAPAHVEVPPPALSGHVVVAGFGRIGRAVASALREAEIPFLVVESSYSLMADVTENGFLGLWGDIAHDEILRAARIPDAKMLLLTMPDQNTVNLAVERARRLSPELILVARSTNIRYLHHLRTLGVSVAVQPEFEGGLEMVRQGLLRYGRDEADTARIVDRLRHEIYDVND
jgi:CPA2 family monovalent cation:H+ antiporter-2